MNKHNIILNADSYKASHWLQYPPNTEYVVSYIESRGSDSGVQHEFEEQLRTVLSPSFIDELITKAGAVYYNETVFFGLQMFLKEYLSKPVTMEMVNNAETILREHGEPFNRAGWEHIVRAHNGYLPIRIKAVSEGTIVPIHNALVTVENTDPKCFWLTSYIETALLRAVWYPTTVATNSWSIKQVIRKYLEETSDGDIDALLVFMLHDFGARGVSSFESAGIGGAAHLVNFRGTDTVTALQYVMEYYQGPQKKVPAFSVPAAEHSSITTWMKKREREAYTNMLGAFEGYPIISVVSDSYDIYNAVNNIWGNELKQMVIDSGSTLVIRPDSGDPVTVVTKILKLLDERFGSEVNTKGYKVLKHVRVLQGDGINQRSIERILEAAQRAGFSAQNLVFGMGGALLQQVNRDTLKFALKACAARVDGRWIDVYKDPITDPGKTSKRGRLMLYRDRDTGELLTERDGAMGSNFEPTLQTVFENGNLVKEYDFEEIRQRSQEHYSK